MHPTPENAEIPCGQKGVSEMKPNWLNLTILFGLLLALTGSVGARAQDPVYPQTSLSNAFTYQGHLAKDGAFANGSYDFRFILYDAEVGGSQAGNIVTEENLTVIEGFFTVMLDFGPGALNGDARYLEIAVRDGGSTGSYTTLSPRQMLAATPYATYAASAPWSGLTNVPSGLNDGDDDTLDGLVCAGNQIAKWDGSNWICANDDKGPTYTAGTGLSLNGGEFSVVVSAIQRRVSSNCSEGASIRRINEDGSVVCEPDNDTLGGLVCANNQIAKWNGSSWVCADDIQGPTYTAGTGLSLISSQFSVDTSVIQPRVTATCSVGSAIREINADGTVVCEADDNTTYSAGNQLSLAGTTFSVVEGNLSGLDADLLDGHDSSFYQSATNIDAGTLSTSFFSAREDLIAEGHLGNIEGDLAQNNGVRQVTLNADLLDGQEGSYYRDADKLDGYHADQLVTGAFAGGDQSLDLDISPTVVRSLTIVARSAGVIIVTASGTAEFVGAGLDVIQCSINTGNSLDTNYLMQASDFGAAASPSQFVPFSLTRGYSVPAGTYAYNLVCAESGSSSVTVQDTNISAIFTYTP